MMQDVRQELSKYILWLQVGSEVANISGTDIVLT